MTRFTDSLRESSEPRWTAAVTHRFVTDLYRGAVPADVMARYLVQDYRFLDAFLALLGGAMATADTPSARLRLGRFVGMVTTDENDYFLRAFDALGVSARDRAATPDLPPTTGFQDIMREAASSGSYAACLAVLNVAEWLYLDWASRAPQPLPGDFIHAEWITLHDNPEFRDFVGFLRGELDRVGPADPQTAQDFFGRAVGLELAFFDAAYSPDEA